MRCRRKSRRKPIHARKGNSLWALIDNFRKTFVIARAHLGHPFCFAEGKLPVESALVEVGRCALWGQKITGAPVCYNVIQRSESNEESHNGGDVPQMRGFLAYGSE